MFTIQKVWQSIRNAIPKSIKTSIWLIKITVPVALLVFVLDSLGIIESVSIFLGPIFQFVGLPNETALVMLTSVFTNIYSVVAVLSTLGLDMHDTVILAIMSLISHALLPETIIQRKAGSSAKKMVFMRLITSFVTGIVLNLILPDFNSSIRSIAPSVELSFIDSLFVWAKSMFGLCFRIVMIITALLVLQNILNDFGIIQKLSSILSPLIRVFGLSESVTLSWLVANSIGLSYGSAILLQEVENKKMKRSEADLLNHHLAISHSQLEDPLLFLPLGLPLLWLIIPRVILAVCIVWCKRMYHSVLKRS